MMFAWFYNKQLRKD